MSEVRTRSNEIPMLATLARNPLMASTISKAVDQPTNSGASTIRDAKSGAMVSLAEMHQMSQTMQQSRQNYESFFQLFPDMNIDRSIVVGGVLAPNNMFREELNYSIDNREVDTLIAGPIVDYVKKEVEQRYHLIQDLREIVNNALFDVGSHVKLIIPESGVDYLINSSTVVGGMRMESATHLHTVFDQTKPKFSLGLLANPGDAKQSDIKFRGESWKTQADLYNPTWTPGKQWDAYPEMKAMAQEMAANGSLSLTDDFSILKKPFYSAGVAKEVVRDRIDGFRNGIETIRMEAHKAMLQRVEELRLRQESGMVGGQSELTKATIGDQVENARTARMDTVAARDQTAGDINISRLQAAVFKAAPSQQEFFARIPQLSNLKRHSIGPCLYVDAPSEAFIPIHYPGQPKDHLGYFALVDPSSGYFISLETQRQHLASYNNQASPYMSNVSTNGNTNSSLASSLVNKASQNLVNADQSTPLRYHPEIFAALLVEDYLERLKSGALGFQMEARMASMLSYVMMARANAGRQTQVVFIPAEFVSYFAFDHNADGTGRSMLAGVTNLLSLRAAALYSRVANQIRNAISITDVNVQMDPRDHQPQKTLMKVVDLVTQSRAQFFPWGLNSASDIWSWWNRAGYQLNVEGHPALPTTKISYEQRKHDHNLPDIADDGYIKDMVGHHFGITPEMKDAGTGADFATSVVNNNILFATREHGLQLKLNPQLTSHVQKLIYNDRELFAGVREMVTKKWGELKTGFSDKFKAIYNELEDNVAIDNFMRVVVDSLVVKLPPPEATTIQNQSQTFSDFCDAVDKAFEHVLKDEALSKVIFGENVIYSAEMALIAKAEYKRDWMRKNGYMVDLLDMGRVDKDGKPDSKLLRRGTAFALDLAKNVIGIYDEFKARGERVKIDIGLRTNELTPEEAEEQLAALQSNPIRQEAEQTAAGITGPQDAALEAAAGVDQPLQVDDSEKPKTEKADAPNGNPS